MHKIVIHFITHSILSIVSYDSVLCDVQWYALWSKFCPVCEIMITIITTIFIPPIGGHDLDLVSMLARCLLGFVIWYKCLVATFGVSTIVTVPNGGFIPASYPLCL